MRRIPSLLLLLFSLAIFQASCSSGSGGGTGGAAMTGGSGGHGPGTGGVGQTGKIDGGGVGTGGAGTTSGTGGQSPGTGDAGVMGGSGGHGSGAGGAPADGPRMDSASGAGGSDGSTDASISDSAPTTDGKASVDSSTETGTGTVQDAGDSSTGTGPLSCNHPVAIANTVGNYFVDMDVDDQFVYWEEFYVPLAAGGTGTRVSRVPVDGSEPAVPLFEAACPSNGNVHGEYASDANNLYITCGQSLDNTRAVQILRVPKNGDAPTPLFISDTSVVSLSLGVDNMGGGDGTIYFSANNSSALYSIPMAGGSPTKLLQYDDPVVPFPAFVIGFYVFATSGANVYWGGTYNYSGTLIQMPKVGGTPVLIASDDALVRQIDNIVIHGGYFYWRGPAGEKLGIWRLPLAGGTPTLLSHIPGPWSTTGGQLAIFGNNIYFAGYDPYNLIIDSIPLNPVTDGDAGAVGAPTVIGKIVPPTGFANGASSNHVAFNSTHLFVSDPGAANDGHIYRCE
jgi:hypothetical protein